MTTLEPGRSERANPLDNVMTKAQVVRRKFKSALPRKPENRELTKWGAVGQAIVMLANFQRMMEDAGLDPEDVRAGLIFHLPSADMVKDQIGKYVLPDPELYALKNGALVKIKQGQPMPKGAREPTPAEQVRTFGDKVMMLPEPVEFLAVMFHQTDREATQPDKQYTIFAWPLLIGPRNEKLLRNYLRLQAGGGLQATAN